MSNDICSKTSQIFKFCLVVEMRKDRLTSGVLIFARSASRSREMEALISGREVQKEYIEPELPDMFVTPKREPSSGEEEDRV